MRDAGAFLEHATVFGNSATAPRAIRSNANSLQAATFCSKSTGRARNRSAAPIPPAVSLFILPPSHHALSERLRRRGEDNDEAIGKRTAEAVIEMSHHDEYDYVIVNDRFDDAVADLRAIIRAERLRTSRQARRREALLRDLLSHDKPIQ